MTEPLHPYPLEGGSYRIIDGQLVREDAPVAPIDATTETESTGDAATTRADPLSRRRGKNED